MICLADNTTTPYDDLLGKLFAAVDIVSPTEYAWCGRRCAPLSAKIAASLSAEAARNYLVQRLTDRLYSSFYTLGRIEEEESESDELANEAPELVAQLSQVNHGLGPWIDGWRVERVDEDRVCVGGDGLRLTVPFDRVRIADPSIKAERATDAGDSFRVGQAVFVRFPHQQLAISPGHYVAQGDVPFPCPDETNNRVLLRVYFNATTAAAVALMDGITDQLNRQQIPFEFKVMKSLATTKRSDTAVLYVGSQDASAVMETLQSIYGRVRDGLRDPVPALTQRIAPGIGVAQNPLDGGSFGEHRCRLIAEAIVTAADQNVTSSEARQQIARDVFLDAQVDVRRPYASMDHCKLFESMSVIPPSNVPRRRKRFGHEQPRARSFGNQRWNRESQQRSLASRCEEAAYRLAHELARQAIWADNGRRCTWLASSPASSGQASTLDASVYQGTAGVALFLARAAERFEDKRLRQAAFAGANQSLATASELCDDLRYGMYMGELGAIASCVHVSELLDDSRLRKSAASAFRSFHRRPFKCSEFDIVGGAAGGVLAALDLAQLSVPGAADDAVTLGDWLLKTADNEKVGCCWNSPSIKARRGLTGYSHGAAGVGHALARLARFTGQTRFSKFASAAFDYERSWLDARRGNWPDFREDENRFAGDREAFGCSWCHGAPGIAISRMGADGCLPRDDRFRLDGAIAVESTRCWLTNWLNGGHDVSPCRCHGFLGNLEVIVQAQDHRWARSSAADLRLIRRTALVALNRCLHVESGWGKCEAMHADPALMVGLSGVADCFLRLSEFLYGDDLPPTDGSLR